MNYRKAKRKLKQEAEKQAPKKIKYIILTGGRKSST